MSHRNQQPCRTSPLALLIIALKECALFSGASALIYQIVWMRQFAIFFGMTSIATTTVLAVFMAGLSLGSGLLGRMADRLSSPVLFYAALEGVLGCLGLLSGKIIDLAQMLYLAILSDFQFGWLFIVVVRVMLAVLTLLPFTMIMGGTFPALLLCLSVCAQADLHSTAVSERFGLLYVINTVGAVLGVVLAITWLIPHYGFQHSIQVAALLNISCAVALGGLAWWYGEGRLYRHPNARSDREQAHPLDLSEATQIPNLALLIRIPLLVTFICGCISLALEVVWTRYLIYVQGSNSVEAFGATLVSFLVGIALGSLCIARRLPASSQTEEWLRWGMFAYSCAILVSPILMPMLSLPQFANTIIASSLVRSFVTLLPPTLLSGALFTLVAYRAATILGSDFGGAIGRATGLIYAYNTAGAIVGAVCGGFFLLPCFGLAKSLVILVLLTLAAGLFLPWKQPMQSTRLRLTCTCLSLVIGTGCMLVLRQLSPEALLLQDPDDQLIFYEDGPESSIAVTRHDQSLRFIVDGDIQAGTSSSDLIHLRFLGHLPALFHRNPHRALLVCLGAGISAGSLLTHSIDTLDIVELSPIVPRIQEFFAPWNYQPLRDPRVSLFRDDGRNFLLRSQQIYDIITTDPLDPNDAGSTLLYSREYFELVRQHLSPGGIAAQWLPPAPFDDPTFTYYRNELRTFASVFPVSMLWQADFTTVIIGINGKFEITAQEVENRLQTKNIHNDLSQIGINDLPGLLNHYIADTGHLAAFIGEGSLSTDDTPILEYHAARPLGITTSKSAPLFEALQEFRVHRDLSWLVQPE